MTIGAESDAVVVGVAGEQFANRGAEFATSSRATDPILGQSPEVVTRSGMIGG